MENFEKSRKCHKRTRGPCAWQKKSANGNSFAYEMFNAWADKTRQMGRTQQTQQQAERYVT